MSYSQQEWVDNDLTKPLSAARMAYLEAGLAAVADDVDQKETISAVASAVATLTAADATLTTNVAAKVTDSVLAAGAPAGAERLLTARASDTVVLDDFYLAADAGNYALTLARALTYAVAQGKGVRLTRIYPYSTTAVLPSGSSIIGSGPETGFVGPTDAPVKLFSTLSGKTDISLDNFALNGGVTPALGVNSTRGMQFEDTLRIRLHRMHIKNCADWAVSFKRCSDVTVTRHTHTGGGLGNEGGRDALHFLDCSNVLVDGAVIDSGDDCVAVTSETVGNSDITIRNISGFSDIGSVVICNEEGVTTFPTTNMNVSGIRTRGTVRDVVRIYTLNSTTQLTGIKISDVKGTSRNHGIYLTGNSAAPMKDVSVSDVDVVSTLQHGIYLNQVQSFTVSGAGKSLTGLFDGINVSNSTHGYVKPRSRGSAYWGCHIYNSTDITVDTPVLIDCGGVNRATPTGGAMRVEGSTDVSVIDGSLVGDPAISYYSMHSATGNTRFRMTPTTRLAAEVLATAPAPLVLFSALTDAATVAVTASVGAASVTLAGNRTMGAPSGTAENGQRLLLRVRQDATGTRTLAWNAIYRFTGGTAVVLTTTPAKTDYITFSYNSTDSKWDCVATAMNL